MLYLKLSKIPLLITFILITHGSSAKQSVTINNIQGHTDASAMIGKKVQLEGIVTANFQEDKKFAGFFIQSENTKPKQRGSSGIFVFEKDKKVTVGELVRIKGTVSEHKGGTQISKVTSIRALKHDQPLPKAVAIKLPLKNYKLENLEGMLVTLDSPAYITDHYNYIKYGEFTVSSKLLMNPTNNASPGPKASLLKKQNYNDRLLIDDGSYNLFPQYQEINTKSPIQFGAKVQVVGVLHYAFDSYRLELTQPIKFKNSPYATGNRPKNIPGHVKIASFNLKNYFTTIDDGKIMCGPNKNFGCRGADSNKEFVRQQTKLVNAINSANADVFALQELENNEDSIKTLVNELNKDANSKKWKYIKTGTLGEDVIKVGLIYQRNKVTPVGQHKILNPKAMPDFEADKNRDVLLQSFKDSKDNVFRIAVVHLKSKRCTDAVGADLDQKDGQGCYNISRVKVAQQISKWLSQKTISEKVTATIIAGDFNAYSKEQPLSIFAKNSFTNLNDKFLGAENWTSIFRGKVGSIDHIIVNPSALKAAKGMTQWHINSTVSGWFDYNLEDLAKSKPKPRNFYDTSPFASSDHDIIIAGFDFSQK